ncbi:hypothetical protein I203_108174 [Kwoniella mangroviensis CBS 8507]|uniref:hypothetical protein n=1 Tax=Kwoniella mangroviensis CBS 8507 TaxID=1296122 RepID=UPI00080D2E67|nr:uncharacterized protein I203_05068 [Kwoniella mangroviensis CBS 8507]OCF66045.1 hypothetical protein I203_05068 [Kwoniella mangroviensis CBS 8507]
MAPSSEQASSGQLPIPASSFSRDREYEAGPSSSSTINMNRNRSYRPSPTPSSSNAQPTGSITQELFRITQILLALDSDTRKFMKDTNRSIDNLRQTVDERMEGLRELVESSKDQGKEISEVTKVMLEGLEGKVEGLERVCGDISRSQSQSLVGSGIEIDGMSRKEKLINSQLSRIQSVAQSDRDGTQEVIDEQPLFDNTLDDSDMGDTNSLPRDTENDRTQDGNEQNVMFVGLNEDNGVQSSDMDVGIDPQDIMRSPSTAGPSVIPQSEEVINADGPDAIEKGLRRKIAAVLTREQHEHDGPSASDNLNEAGYQEPVPTRTTRSRRKSARGHEQEPSSNRDRSQSSSMTATPDGEEFEEGVPLKPPPRSPFPPRPLVNLSASLSPDSQLKKKRGRPQKVMPHDQVQVYRRRDSTFEPPAARHSQKQPKGSVGQEDHQDPESSVGKEGSVSPRKRRRKGTATASIKPESQTKPKMNVKHDKKFTQKGTARLRKFNGQVRLAIKCLAASDGHKTTEADWPNKGPNTAKGRLEEIVCDTCKGRCHWSCAGIPEEKDMSQENWICPDCAYRMEVEDTPAVLIDPTQQLKCIRYNCILREKRAIEHQDGEEERYFVEKIVGRRAIARETDSQKRIFQYLVKWDGYDLDECTWEPLANLEHHSECLLRKFEDTAKRTKSNLKLRVCILPEARKHWDEISGNAIVDATKSENDSVQGDEDEEEEDQDPIRNEEINIYMGESHTGPNENDEAKMIDEDEEMINGEQNGDRLDRSLNGDIHDDGRDIEPNEEVIADWVDHNRDQEDEDMIDYDEMDREISGNDDDHQSLNGNNEMGNDISNSGSSENSTAQQQPKVDGKALDPEEEQDELDHSEEEHHRQGDSPTGNEDRDQEDLKETINEMRGGGAERTFFGIRMF